MSGQRSIPQAPMYCNNVQGYSGFERCDARLLSRSFLKTDECLRLIRFSIHILYFVSEHTRRNFYHFIRSRGDLETLIMTRTHAATRPRWPRHRTNLAFLRIHSVSFSLVPRIASLLSADETKLSLPHTCTSHIINLHSLGGDAWINFEKWTTSLISSRVNMPACSNPINSCCLEFPTKLCLKNDGKPPCLSRMI